MAGDSLGIFSSLFSSKKREDELERLRLQNELVLNSVAEGIFGVDTSGKIIFVNRAAVEILGYNVGDELLGASSHGTVHCPSLKGEMPTKEKCPIFQTLRDGKVHNSEEGATFCCKDGTRIAVDFTGSPMFDERGNMTGEVVVFSDITEHKKKEDEILEQKNLLQRTEKALLNVMFDIKDMKDKDEAILSSIGEGLVAVDWEGRVIMINTKAESLLGIKKNEVIGQYYTDLWQVGNEEGDILPLEQRPVQVALSGGNVSILTQSPYWYIRRDGKRFPVAITVAPIFLNGKIDGAIDIFRDITKEKEIDRIKSEFISIASHQLRTPLSSTKWAIEILMESKGLTKKQRDYLNDLYVSNERLIDLVNNLLDVARKEESRIIANKKVTDIKELLDISYKMTKPYADKKGQKIKIDIKADTQKIKIDPVLFSDVINNLLKNATDYAAEDSEINVTLVEKGNDYVIAVHNIGIVVPEDDYGKMFTRFYRAPEALKIKAAGSGLGLYIAKIATEANGGKIWFESSLDKGTTFYFTVPIS